MRRLLAAALLLGASAAAWAEQFVRQGDFVVHYAAMASADLAPEVAQSFGLQRSRRRAVLTLNAQRLDRGNSLSVPAAAKGIARSLLGHTQTLALRAAREGTVHYVLAEFEALDQEWLNFEISVLPEGATQPLAIRFKQQFYTE